MGSGRESVCVYVCQVGWCHISVISMLHGTGQMIMKLVYLGNTGDIFNLTHFKNEMLEMCYLN